MFQKILIANRGEIACRIMQTAQKMGIQCVAVYSTIDEHALHVQMADEAYWLGDAPSQDSYLRGDKIIAIAKKSQAEAIHPGYGFLSENADFAEACLKAGLVFIGPSPKAILAMGDKSKAKAIMEKAQIPCTPGYHGDNQDADFLLKEAQKIGFPVLIKAAQGGGGKGMRKVENARAFKEALESAQREATSSFGDNTVLLEKYLENPRHIEIQIMADNHGNAVYLFERDCSIQRRHQKIIEEAPAIDLPSDLRRKMGETAVMAAKAIGYSGAGTLEFLVNDADTFYFMEMNTRLQVEHPVTEIITGLDLVAWQLKIAANAPLPCSQDDIKAQGHAIEVRLYAEDPSHDFLPAIGQIRYLSWPTASDTVRVDSGVEQDDTISPYYDPMMAKLIVHASTRSEAIDTLKNALKQTHIIGVKNNKLFLQNLIDLKDYTAGKLNTGFIAQHESALKLSHADMNDTIVCGAALYEILHLEIFVANSEDTFSPWHRQDGFRLELSYQRVMQFKDRNTVYTVKVVYHSESCYSIFVNDRSCEIEMVDMLAASSQSEPDVQCGHAVNTSLYALTPHPCGARSPLDIGFRLRALHCGTQRKMPKNIDEAIHYMKVVGVGQERWIICENKEYYLEVVEDNATAAADSEKTGHLNAPMPGVVIAVHVKNGDKVRKDDCLMLMEAMKMEHSIYAPEDGVVREVFYSVGDLVEEGAELLVMEV